MHSVIAITIRFPTVGNMLRRIKVAKFHPGRLPLEQGRILRRFLHHSEFSTGFALAGKCVKARLIGR